MRRLLPSSARIGACAIAIVVLCSAAPALRNTDAIVTVDVAPSHRISTFRTLDAIGSTVDKEPAGTIPTLYSPHNVREILAAGLGWLSYRLFTELSYQDWHWNPSGQFSAGNAGYWVGNSKPAFDPISESFGYKLAHRGSTTDQGSNEDYSRLDDGDPHTYWKSNPYLTSAFTGEPDSQHPQWAMIDLGSTHAVDAIRIQWGNPYATEYAIAYWTGSDPIGEPLSGTWKAFPNGRVHDSRGGVATLELAPDPVAARFVRVLMTQSSGTCDSHGASDRRDCAGYAIGELSIGTLQHGVFHDLVYHAPCGGLRPGLQPCGERQTNIYVSSTDPWHSQTTRVRDQLQPGLDLIASDGLTRGMPAMYPVPMLYSTPENAVAEVRYLLARHYPIARIELGEEPDGQYISPEDYGALYLQWAKALHRIAPNIPLGGPVFQGANSDVQTWPDARGNGSFLTRFLQYLRMHRAMSELSFMSFEHYPFGGCEHGDALLADLEREPAIVRTVVTAWRRDGLPANVPMYVTEANFSAVNFTQTPMQIEGALWLADYMGAFLENGVSGIVYYQDEPVPLSQNRECPRDWGNLTMFAADRHAHIRARTAQFYGAQMIATQWLDPRNGMQTLSPSKSSTPLVTSYAVRRSGDLWSVMLVNKGASPVHARIAFRDGSSRTYRFTGAVTLASFGSAQYVWRAAGSESAPNPDGPPRIETLGATDDGDYTIPAQSITVLRGRIGLSASNNRL